MSRQKTIALLSDNSELAETLQLDLEEEGYCVIQLTGVEEDRKAIKERKIDLLIFDLDLPVWRMEFIKDAKRINPLLSVVLLSPIEESLTEFVLDEIEIAKTFIKPFELEDFSNSIKSILDSRTRSGPVRGEKNFL
jgi:DNA-binding response OmpR family regulator